MGKLGFAGSKPERRASYCECAADDEPSILPRRQVPEESSKKAYLLCLTATTITVCFCFFVVVPQLIDYFNDSNVIELRSSGYSSQQSIIELPDAERSLRNQERLDIMRRFDALQQKYKELQVEYKKAEAAYLDKLHSAVDEESLGSADPGIKPVDAFAKPNELEIYKIEDVERINEGKREKSTGRGERGASS